MIRATASDIEALRAALAVAEARAEEAVAKASNAEAIIAALKLMVEKLRREIYGQRSERKARLLDQLELQLEEQEALIMCPTVALAAGIICPTVAIAASSTCTSTTAPAWVSAVK